jgi:hypothetical protein
MKLFFVDKLIGSGCFFPDLDPSVNWFGHAAIREMIKLQFTTITDRIRNKIRNGNWFRKRIRSLGSTSTTGESCD